MILKTTARTLRLRKSLQMICIRTCSSPLRSRPTSRRRNLRSRSLLMSRARSYSRTRLPSFRKRPRTISWFRSSWLWFNRKTSSLTSTKESLLTIRGSSSTRGGTVNGGLQRSYLQEFSLEQCQRRSFQEQPLRLCTSSIDLGLNKIIRTPLKT